MKFMCHVGVHKTGTSALQAFLHDNRFQLRERGVWYDTPEGHANHSPIALAFRNNEQIGLKSIRRSLEAADRANCAICLYSSEVFCEHPFHADEFIEAVAGVETEIFAYIRRPDDMIVSAHNELVRAGWTSSISEKRPYDPTYRSPLRHWTGERPWKLVIAPYDQPQWHGGNLLTDFLWMTGIDSTDLKFPDQSAKVNKSLPTSLIEVLRVINGAGFSPDMRGRIISCLYEVSELHPGMYKSENLLTPDQRKAYVAEFSAHAGELRRYFRPSFDEAFLK